MTYVAQSYNIDQINKNNHTQQDSKLPLNHTQEDSKLPLT